MRHKQHSPYGRLVAASILGPALLFAATAAWSWHRENREARSDINRTTQLLEEHAARMFQLDKLIMDRARDHVAPLSWPDVAARESELHEFLQRMVSTVPEVDSVFVADAAGEPEVSSMTHPVPIRLHLPPTTANLANRTYFQEAQAGAQLAIGGPFVGHISHHPVFTLAEPLTGPGGAFSGVVALNISPATVTAFWQPLIQHGDIVALVKADGMVLARFPEAIRRSDSKPVRFSPAALTAFRQADTGLYEVPVSPIDGRSRLIGYRRIPGTPVFVTYGMDRANLLREWYPTVAAFGGLSLAASLALILSSLAVIRRGRAEARAHWQAEQVAEALRESEARQRALYDRTPVPMQSADPDGRLLAVSERWLELLGYTREEVLGRPFVDFLAPASVPAFQAGWLQMLTFGEVRDVERQLRRKDGAVVDVLISARLERDAAGRFVRTAAVLIDVTEKKRIEHALQQAQKMEAIGQMTGGVAHDFNNLLMVVMGSLERLLERADQQQAVRRLAGTAMRAVERGANLTAQLLAYSRRQMLRPEIVNPNRLIREFARLIEQAAGERVAVQYVLSTVLDPARIDPAQFQTAILNLVVNARDAMPDGGRITIETRNLPVTEEEAPPGLSSGDYILVSVADTGCGIDKPILEKVFEPFFTTKEVGKGSGLGLSMVYGFVKQSGGYVAIDSEPGIGTTVKLLLPRSTAREMPAEAPRRVATEDTGSGTVLVVEDNPDVLAAASEMLQALGYSIATASNAADALAILHSGRDVDVLFSDVLLPGGMLGEALAREAQRVRPGLRVLLTSGYAGSADAAEAGMVFLAKPYRRAELTEKLQEAMRRPAGPVRPG